ncbi:hypothetical protein [Ligilactobacillus apodemi]|uniref:hypothetical protein n=1 Tax=Ligilactobacillus apodemi TaxID=307126 RepID=UPI00214CF048|nr:hypothetical protein [Ligilactobacillus apodemi]MCR1901404.1 hypothetical protein [Ligilactobacillus apodemi]
MFEISDKINCLSCSLKYIIEKQISEKIMEHNMMVDEKSMLIDLNSYDTGMNDVLWDWINRNLKYHINTDFVENIPNSILNLPISYLNGYAEVYNTKGLEDTGHFVVLNRKNKQSYSIYDLFIPTLPISSKKTDILFDEVGTKQLVIDQIVIMENKNKEFVTNRVLVNSNDFWNMLSIKYINLKPSDALNEIVKLGESTLYGSRLMLTKWIPKCNYNFFQEWNNLWLFIRVNLYKYRLSGDKKYREKIIKLIDDIGKKDIELLEVVYDSYR